MKGPYLENKVPYHLYLGSRWIDLPATSYTGYDAHATEIVRISLKSAKNEGHFIWAPNGLLAVRRLL